PTADDNVFAFHLATEFLEIIKDLMRRDDDALRLGFESDENINIQSADRLQIECCRDCSADRVAANETVGFHSIQHFKNALNIHAARVRLSSSINGQSFSPKAL